MPTEPDVIEPHHGALHIQRHCDQTLIVAKLPTTNDRGELLPTYDIGADDFRFTAAFRDGSQIVRMLSAGQLNFAIGEGAPPDFRHVSLALSARESASFPEHIETPYAVERVTADGKRLLVDWGVIRATSHPVPATEV